MTLSDALALLFGGLTLVSTLSAAFMWVGQQKSKQIEQDRRIKALEDKLEEHGETAALVARLDERLGSLTDAVNRQPQLIGQVVAAAIKETLRVLRPAI